MSYLRNVIQGRGYQEKNLTIINIYLPIYRFNLHQEQTRKENVPSQSFQLNALCIKASACWGTSQNKYTCTKSFWVICVQIITDATLKQLVEIRETSDSPCYIYK
jgi:hypothetical protein